MFEITINTMAFEVEAPTPEQVEAGHPPQLAVQVIGGTFLPLADPRSGGPLQIPAQAVNFNLDRESALKVAEALKEKAEALPEPKKLPKDFSIASSMSDVERLAEQTKKLT